MAEIASRNYTQGLDSWAKLLGETGDVFENNKAANLKKYLQAQEPVIAGKKQAAQNAANLETLKSDAFQKQLTEGGSAKAGDLSVGADPYAHQALKTQQGDAAARMAANKTYMAGLPKIQQAAEAASHGLDAVNDPNNIMSKGELLGAVTRAYGLTRFPNAEEAKQILPPTVYGHFTSILNMGGDDNNPLNGPARQSANSLFKGILDESAIKHKMLKQNAMNMYTSSPYANEMGMQSLSGMGAPVEQGMAQAAQKYQATPQTKGPDLSGQPQPGIGEKVGSALHGVPGKAVSGLAGFFNGLMGGGTTSPQTKQGKDGKTYTKNPQSGLWESE